MRVTRVLWRLAWTLGVGSFLAFCNGWVLGVVLAPIAWWLLRKAIREATRWGAIVRYLSWATVVGAILSSALITLHLGSADWVPYTGTPLERFGGIISFATLLCYVAALVAIARSSRQPKWSVVDEKSLAVQAVGGRVVCSQCGHANSPARQTCKNCRAPL